MLGYMSGTCWIRVIEVPFGGMVVVSDQLTVFDISYVLRIRAIFFFKTVPEKGNRALHKIKLQKKI